MIKELRKFFVICDSRFAIRDRWWKLKPYFPYMIISGISILVVVSFISIQYEKRKKSARYPEEVEMNVVKVIVAKQEDFRQVLEIMGTIKGSTENELRFEISGILSSFNFDSGDNVNMGEVIASLNSRDVMLKLKHAKSKLAAKGNELSAIKKKLTVYEKLYKIGGIIKIKLEEMQLTEERIKNEIEALKAEVALTNSELDKTLLKAPVKGIIAAKNVEIGEVVDPSVIVAKLIGTEFVIIEADIIEKDIEKIKKGQKVKISVDAYPGEIFRGEVTGISPIVEEESRTFVVKTKVPNFKGKLLSGMYARGEIIIKLIKNAIVVPKESVINLGKISVIPLVKPDPDRKNVGKIEIRKIETSYEIKNLVVVKGGITPGELIVKESMTTLKDGMVVQIIRE